MHKLPYDIGRLHQCTESDLRVFQLRYNDISETRQQQLIAVMKNQESTVRQRVRGLEPEIIHEALTYINPLLVYNDKAYGTNFRESIYGNKTIKSGKLREWGQMIDILTRNRAPENWEARLFLFYIPTPRRDKQMRDNGEWSELDQSLYPQRQQANALIQTVENTAEIAGFVNSFNF